MRGTQRVLDLDLDAFVYGSEDGRTRDDPRLDEAVHPPWDVTKVVAFLERHCGLSGPLPGFAVAWARATAASTTSSPNGSTSHRTTDTVRELVMTD